MKCKKCKYKLEKGWINCPICSEPIIENRNYLFLIISAIILLLIFSIFTINNMSPEKRTKNYLKKTYNKSFDKINLVKSVKNPDTSLSCDGSSFGTIKGKGNTEYYRVYSIEDDMEFAVSCDTNKKKYTDTYQYNIKLRKCIGELYEKTKNTFKDYTKKIEFLYDINNKNTVPSQINSIQDLNSILSKVVNNYPDNDNSSYTRLYMYVNLNSIDFCKKEYENLKKINEYLKDLKSNSELYSHISFSICTLDRGRTFF